MNYLIETDSRYILDSLLNKIIKKEALKINYNYKEQSITEVIQEAMYTSLFGEEKYIVVKNATFFGKDKLTDKESTMLLDYLEKQNPLTTIIFTTYEAVDKRKNITKRIISTNGFISKKSPKGYELTNETIKLINKKGYSIDDSSVRYLLQNCLNSWDIINNEIQKFELILPKNSKITKEDVTNIISSNANDNIFKFISAFIEKKGYLCLQLLDDLLLVKTEVLQLLALLAREYRLMIKEQILVNQRFSAKAIMDKLKISEWQWQQIHKNNAYYHLDDLKEALISLSKLDYQIKSGQVDKLVGLRLFLLEQMEY